MTLLTAIQEACGELALPQPATVVGNTDPQAVQLLALAQREGREFSRRPGQWSGWPELRKEYTFNLVPALGNVAGIYLGNTTVGSNIITSIADTTGILVGYGLGGGSIMTGAVVTAVTATTVTVNTPATSAVTQGTFNFGQIAYSLPSDLDFFISATMWDRNFRWQMLGPMSAQEWQAIVSGISPVGPRIRYRIMDNLFYVQPPPGPAQTDLIAYEYISNAWCTSAAGAAQSAWAADSDLYLWNDDLLTLGIKWRFLRAKGLDYGEERDTYERRVEMRMARSGSSRVLPLNARAETLNFLGSANIPDTGYGN